MPLIRPISEGGKEHIWIDNTKRSREAEARQLCGGDIRRFERLLKEIRALKSITKDSMNELRESQKDQLGRLYSPVAKPQEIHKTDIDLEEEATQPSTAKKNKVDADNRILLETESWTVVYKGNSLKVPKAPTNGVRAIAHLLKVKTPKGGSCEVSKVMNREDSDEHRQEIGGKPEDQSISDQKAIDAYEKRLKAIDQLLSLQKNGATISEEEIKKVKEEEIKIKKELGRSVDKNGRLRQVNRTQQKVGQAVNRALTQIEKIQSELHAHLVKSIKGKFGQEIRYEPTPTIEWQVEM